MVAAPLCHWASPLLLILLASAASGLATEEDSQLQRREFPEIRRLSASDAAATRAAFSAGDAPFIVTGLVAADKREALAARVDNLGAERVKVSAYLRSPSPPTQQTSRLMPKEDRTMPLRDFLGRGSRGGESVGSHIGATDHIQSHAI